MSRESRLKESACRRFALRSVALSLNSTHARRLSQRGGLHPRSGIQRAGEFSIWSCSSQILDQLQHLALVFRRDSSRSIARTAVLPFVALLEQPPQAIPRITSELESFRCSFGVDHVWIDAPIARRKSGFYTNDSGCFGIIFARRNIVTMQLVH